MSPEEFSTFRHDAAHALMRLNESCERDFQISSWPRWDYDFELGTLTFSKDGIPQVAASIQVVGTTSEAGGTWLWSWANQSLPSQVADIMLKVRAFGRREKVAELTNPEAKDDEYLGWAMTAIAAKILGSKGAYRCPGENGFIYLVYTDLSFAQQIRAMRETKQIECSTHSTGYSTYVCQHLVSNPAQQWFSDDVNEKNKWPDAWCAGCDALLQEQGEWNSKNESNLKIQMLCHHCYQLLRSRSLS